MSAEKLTGTPLYKKIIKDIADRTDSPEKDPEAFSYHVQHTFGSLVGQVRNSRYWKEDPTEDLNLLTDLLN
jgi:hypothetical protein